MKALIKSALVCMAALAAVTVSAQPQQGQVQGQQGQGQRQQQTPEERARQNTDQLKKDLGLNDTQEKQVYDLQLKMAKDTKKQMDDFRASGQQPDREKMKGSMEKRQKEMSEGMKKILTEDQFATWQKQQQERMSNMGNRGQGQPQQPQATPQAQPQTQPQATPQPQAK